jgi:hypothetical protein
MVKVYPLKMLLGNSLIEMHRRLIVEPIKTNLLGRGSKDGRYGHENSGKEFGS